MEVGEFNSCPIFYLILQRDYPESRKGKWKVGLCNSVYSKQSYRLQKGKSTYIKNTRTNIIPDAK